MPNIRHSSCNDAILLGAPIGDISAIDTVLSNKLTDFQRLASRLTTLGAHDALFLLKNCFGMPKLLYTLRSAPCYQSSILTQYDTVIRRTLQLILNLDLTESVWNQATLPVSRGGLGVRLATDWRCLLFFRLLPEPRSWQCVSYQIAYKILLGYKTFSTPRHASNDKPRCHSEFPDTDKIESQKHGTHRWSPRNWMSCTYPSRVCSTYCGYCTHSGDFLNAVPCSAVGTRLDDTSLRLAIALRLGAIMCAPHTCVCGVQVGGDGTHGPRLQKVSRPSNASQRRQRPDQEGAGLRQYTVIAGTKFVVPWRWQAPDGLTVLPWANGRCLVWDFTCPDTLAASHLNRVVLGSGVVANDAESRKSTKYSSLSALYGFIPIAIETLGVPGDEALSFFHDLGQRIAVATAEPRSFQFLMQRLSVAIQRGNAEHRNCALFCWLGRTFYI